jgi:hypothetical protein
MIDGLFRIGAAAVAGWLLAGWRGAIAVPLLTQILFGFGQDLVDAMAKIARVNR